MTLAARDTISCLLLLATTVGCSGRSTMTTDAGGSSDGAGTHPDRVVIDPRAALCPAPDAAPAPVTYAQIQQIFDDNCVTCHSLPPLNLNAGVSWGDLVNQPATDPDTCGGTLVAPGDPSGSYLHQKLTSATPCYGVQMPKTEFSSNPLPACVIALVTAWITEGAPGPSTDGGGD